MLACLIPSGSRRGRAIRRQIPLTPPLAKGEARQRRGISASGASSSKRELQRDTPPRLDIRGIEQYVPLRLGVELLNATPRGAVGGETEDVSFQEIKENTRGTQATGNTRQASGRARQAGPSG